MNIYNVYSLTTQWYTSGVNFHGDSSSPGEAIFRLYVGLPNTGKCDIDGRVKIPTKMGCTYVQSSKRREMSLLYPGI